jgi:hypothetical protein
MCSGLPVLCISSTFFVPMPPHVPYGLRGLPSRLWPKCNRFLRLGRPPWGAVTLSRWGGYIYEYKVPGGALNLNSTKLPRPWSPWESSFSRKNPHDWTGNQTRDLMISSQKLWPLDHEACQYLLIIVPSVLHIVFEAVWSFRICRQVVSCACYMPRPYHLLSFDHSNKILWRVRKP